MPASMTAFASRERTLDPGTVYWELRGGNHRYLEVQPRLPERLRSLEPDVRERVKQWVGRGRVEAVLRYTPAPAAAALSVDEDLVQRLVDAFHTIDAYLVNPARLSAVDFLNWPGVVQQAEPEMGELAEPALALLDEALAAFSDMRVREGERLKAYLLERCSAIEAEVAGEREHAHTVAERLRERLQKRLSELAVDADPGRIEQEVVIQSQRLDVSEELDRLEAHVAAVRDALGQAGPVGRRLDFLMQELNREANTLGSKAADAERSQAGVELKVLIEQMREQVQNVE
jgi:uncharacterized protein (TIGR00255 family)